MLKHIRELKEYKRRKKNLYQIVRGASPERLSYLERKYGHDFAKSIPEGCDKYGWVDFSANIGFGVLTLRTNVGPLKKEDLIDVNASGVMDRLKESEKNRWLTYILSIDFLEEIAEKDVIYCRHASNTKRYLSPALLSAYCKICSPRLGGDRNLEYSWWIKTEEDLESDKSSDNPLTMSLRGGNSLFNRLLYINPNPSFDVIREDIKQAIFLIEHLSSEYVELLDKPEIKKLLDRLRASSHSYNDAFAKMIELASDLKNRTRNLERAITNSIDFEKEDVTNFRTSEFPILIRLLEQYPSFEQERISLRREMNKISKELEDLVKVKEEI